MLFSCRFTRFPGTTRAAVARRAVEQHETGANHLERLRSWYTLVGGGAGFLLVDYDDPAELTAFLQPYMDPMGFDVRAVTQNAYGETINRLREVAAQAT